MNGQFLQPAGNPNRSSKSLLPVDMYTGPTIWGIISAKMLKDAWR